MSVSPLWTGTRRPRSRGVDRLIGDSAPMQALKATIRRAAGVSFPVLVDGESGTGKELVAQAVHDEGDRRTHPFGAINCAALSDELLEAELFGHTRGAFTGAVAARQGLLDAAAGGTVFLDEVGELSPRSQAKLLRVLQDGEVRTVGDNFSRQLDLRIVAATNRALEVEAREGRFRRDLLYRLDVIHIEVPPLRHRPGDVGRLVDHFWGRTARQAGTGAVLSRVARQALVDYDWPGNVRQLQNVLAALAVAAPGRGEVGPGLLPPAVRGPTTIRRPTLAAARASFDRTWVSAALARAGGRRSVAARELGISRQGLSKLMVRLGL